MSRVKIKIFLVMEPSLESTSHTFTTADNIEGFLTLQAPTDLPCSRLTIGFEGRQKVALERETPRPGLQSLSKSELKFLDLEIGHTSMQAVQSGYLKAGHLYKIPFHFLIPEFTAMGFARSWNDQEPLKDWHALLPPSVHSGTQSARRLCINTSNPPGKIEYNITAKAYREFDSGALQCFGSTEREIRISSRPWQVNLLSISPFVGLNGYPCRNITKGFLRQTVGTILLQPHTPEKGYHSTGQRIGNEFLFQGKLSLTAWFKTENADTKLPRISASSASLHETTSYRLHALSVANPFLGHSVSNVTAIQIAQTHAQHWSTEEHSLGVGECPFDENESTRAMISSQKIEIAWRWSTENETCPSFSSALISRWYSVQTRISYSNLEGNTIKTLQCGFPLKLSVQPSTQSSVDVPIHQVPAYSEVAPFPESGNFDVEGREDLPPYS